MSFDKLNEDWEPPIQNLPPVPQYIHHVIASMLRNVWIFHLVYREVPLTYLIRKCGEGKSLVLLGMATLLRGITLSMVLLIGLGSDQVSKSRQPNNHVEAWHFDKFKGSDFTLLCLQMQQYSPDNK